MRRESPGLSRRQLLSAVGGAGAFSALGGAATGAYVADHEGVSVGMRGGEVAITVACEGGSCTDRDGLLGFRFDDIEPGSAGEERFHLSIDGNPARVWIRTTCPPIVDPLGEALRVRLTVEDSGDGRENHGEDSEDDHGDGAEETRLFPQDEEGDDPEWGSLDEFRDALSDGLRLDDEADPCLSAEDDVRLRLAYELPAEATWVGDLETALEFELFAEQCRHVSEAAVENPFEETDCPTLECPDCVQLGKIEVENDRLGVGRHAFDELEDPFAVDGHRYEVDVLAETVKDDDRRETICVGFRLLRDGDENGAPPVCAVDVAGGPAPGTKGPNTTTYDVQPPTTRTRGEVCAEETSAGNGGSTQPAISHLVVYVCPDGAENGGGTR